MRREAADSRIEALQATNETIRDELKKEKEVVCKVKSESSLEAHSLSKRLEDVRLEEERDQDKCRKTAAEMKRRLAKADGEVKEETDATEKVRAQLNRESHAFQAWQSD